MVPNNDNKYALRSQMDYSNDTGSDDSDSDGSEYEDDDGGNTESDDDCFQEEEDYEDEGFYEIMDEETDDSEVEYEEDINDTEDDEYETESCEDAETEVEDREEQVYLPKENETQEYSMYLRIYFDLLDSGNTFLTCELTGIADGKFYEAYKDSIGENLICVIRWGVFDVFQDRRTVSNTICMQIRLNPDIPEVETFGRTLGREHVQKNDGDHEHAFSIRLHLDVKRKELMSDYEWEDEAIVKVTKAFQKSRDVSQKETAKRFTAILDIVKEHMKKKEESTELTCQLETIDAQLSLIDDILGGHIDLIEESKRLEEVRVVIEKDVKDCVVPNIDWDKLCIPFSG
ncbi:PREDICTED: uncharacterized protein LOC104763263 [Camelina sativa]|uniref:Uncharacterized protein LOC104763263 n=1 Tax=Camelina sativa TaxID=90675 RepID=A0ABM0XF02_CAMSA|nr:PREDICTED: uncharacterized protein LOC104763263 [Camelina sativa]